MRLFHTSDWHLGQSLHGQERDFEHACYLDWLLGQEIPRRRSSCYPKLKPQTTARHQSLT